MNTYDISLFTHCKDSKTFVTELSDLGIRPGELMPHTIRIHNPKTDGCVDFELVQRKDDNEGDVMYWTYAPTQRTKDLRPQMRGYVVEVFND